MHAEVIEWVSRYATGAPVALLDIGGRDVNGTPRDLYPAADYTVLDIRPDTGVDVVADAAMWTPDRVFDVVLCTEVFEHTADWPGICRTAFAALRPGGRFVATCAGPGRAPHSAIAATGLQPGEYYGNVEPADLHRVLVDCGFRLVVVDQQRLDVRATAVR